MSNILQTKDIDIAKASLLLTNAQAELKIFRNDFDSVKQSAEELCRKWNIEPVFENKRGRVTRRLVGCNKDFPNDAESRFRINIFYGCLDIILSKLVERLRGLNEVQTVLGFDSLRHLQLYPMN